MAAAYETHKLSLQKYQGTIVGIMNVNMIVRGM